MKKILFFATMFLISASSFSQQTNPEKAVTLQDYLKKSKNQKKAGSILLAGGAVLIITGIVIPKGDLTESGACVGSLCDVKYENDGIKSAFFILGSVSALSSIPLFILSKKNRRKATSIGFKIENTVQLNKQSFVYTRFPSLRMKVNL
jgi:hypothetical protein